MEVNAFETFLDRYAERGIGAWLWPHIEACARHGIAYLSAQNVLLMRPVDVRYPVGVLNNLVDIEGGWQIQDLTSPHAGWHVLYASGKLHEILKMAPFPLPWALWERLRENGKSKIVKIRFSRLYD